MMPCSPKAKGRIARFVQPPSKVAEASIEGFAEVSGLIAKQVIYLLHGVFTLVQLLISGYTLSIALGHRILGR